MITKKEAIDAINSLPDSFTLDDVFEKLVFIERFDKALKESNEGKGYTTEEAKETLKKWLK